MGLSIDEQKAVERFKTDVVEPSMSNSSDVRVTFECDCLPEWWHGVQLKA